MLQVGLVLKLIDLDCATVYNAGDVAGSKFSSAYIPPEMSWKIVLGEGSLEKSWKSTLNRRPSRTKQRPHRRNPSLLADPSQDMWALGCVMYLLCTGSTLFQSTVQDNLSNESDYDVLRLWEDAVKEKKLAQIPNKLARNLVSLLLSKDRERRPTAQRALEHPFFTGKSVTRLIGDRASWDVFISYRVDTDSEIARLLYDSLTSSGLKVWWDARCLKAGQNWEEGFCSGLVDCSAVLCLMSRGGMKNPSKPWMNFENLERDSRCDNVLLEWRLALELNERGMIEGIFPVMVGDVDSNGHYSNYFKSGCKPDPPDIPVDQLENKLREHLGREGLGLPYRDYESIASIVQRVLLNQGGFVEGNLQSSIATLASSIHAMVEEVKQKGNPEVCGCVGYGWEWDE